MAKIARKTQKIFAVNSGATGTTQFGSTASGSTVYDTDIANIQNTAFQTGWLAAVLAGTKRLPTYQDQNAVNYVVTTQLANIFQDGIPVYDAGTPYYTDSIVRQDTTTNLYKSLTDNNTGNTLSNGTYWTLLGDLANLINVKPSDIPFAMNSGNVDASGNADILAYSGTTLSFKVGGTYPNLAITYADKTQENLTSLTNITGLTTNGTYTVVKENGSNPVALLSTNVTQGKTFPTSPSNGDYHCLTATELKTYKRVSGAWVETQYVTIGPFVVAGNVITSVATNPYNQNGYNTPECGFPSNKYIDLTLGASGSTYTAPADGILYLSKYAGDVNKSILMYNSVYGRTVQLPLSTALIELDFPAKKGDVITYVYDVTGDTNRFRFIYSEGSKP